LEPVHVAATQLPVKPAVNELFTNPVHMLEISRIDVEHECRN